MTFSDIFHNSVFNTTTCPVTAVAIALILCFFCYKFWQYRGVPPGPLGLPIFGYWPFLKSKDIHLQLQKLREKYSEIYSLSVTGNLFISLNSAKLIKEAHIRKSECFGDKFSGYSLLSLSFEEAVPIANGESWRVQRKFFQQKFKEYGMMAIKENFSGAIYDSLKETVRDIQAMNGEPFSITELLTVKCSSIIRRILFNDQGITEEEVKELNYHYEPVIKSMTHANLLLMGNIARYFVFPFMPSYWAMIRGHNNIQKIVGNVIRRHKDNFDENQVFDIIDCFYKEKKDRETKGDPTSRHFTDKALLSSVYQFVTDGVLSIAFFIGLFFEKLGQYPEEQENIYKELLDVLGPDRQPTMDDKSKLPHTNAFFYEVIRCGDFFSFFPSLKSTKETSLRGYRIPKGAVTLLNLWTAHHDPNVYAEPYAFNPSRFISEPGKPKAELPIMFGIGKRACMGEPLTLIETFLFVTTIVKNFKLTIPDGSRLLGSFDVGQMKICALPRNMQKHWNELKLIS